MDISILNFILKSLQIKYSATDKLQISGQRQSYVGVDNKGHSGFVVKISPSYPTSVARIQREINILSGLDSEYFPKLYFHSYISGEMLNDVIDNIDPKSDTIMLERIKNANLQPFLITVEQFIENLDWNVCIPSLKQDAALASFLIHIVKAVKLLWDCKIVHRDLKPENILIRPDHKPVIIDLGIAKSFKEGTLDLTGAFFHTPCTPQYAAPEQLFNNRAEITYKTDQFSIGVIAFFVLSGKFPYGNVEVDGLEQVLENVANKKVCSLEGVQVDQRLLQLVLKLIQVDPYKRFRSPENILEELYKLMEGA